ncbi:hypothetical protein [Streptomyces sp. NPDC001530]|uniref:hypothetical protein n=1 Tax=Streptomyces sp. NPDC001530 TaxID=3364582 RepID=UPI003695029A
MMPRDPDKHSDPAASSVSLAAEAALLEARVRLLQEEIDTVDARIKAVSDALRLLRRTSSASPQAADNADQCGPSGRKDADGPTDDAGEAAKRSTPC